uniref:Uncharacterized protein n=1 Tax=Branchiostoma floridae TaxID=7739 RepID=C3ZJZ3_BRAFL|eukprot:XP_002591149.1 hypothetical protein BRAFLDRAFT_108912 [Branchiostoma floridae]
MVHDFTQHFTYMSEAVRSRVMIWMDPLDPEPELDEFEDGGSATAGRIEEKIIRRANQPGGVREVDLAHQHVLNKPSVTTIVNKTRITHDNRVQDSETLSQVSILVEDAVSMNDPDYYEPMETSDDEDHPEEVPISEATSDYLQVTRLQCVLDLFGTALLCVVPLSCGRVSSDRKAISRRKWSTSTAQCSMEIAAGTYQNGLYKRMGETKANRQGQAGASTTGQATVTPPAPVTGTPQPERSVTPMALVSGTPPPQPTVTPPAPATGTPPPQPTVTPPAPMTVTPSPRDHAGSTYR